MISEKTKMLDDLLEEKQTYIIILMNNEDNFMEYRYTIYVYIY